MSSFAVKKTPLNPFNVSSEGAASNVTINQDHIKGLCLCINFTIVNACFEQSWQLERL